MRQPCQHPSEVLVVTWYRIWRAGFFWLWAGMIFSALLSGQLRAAMALAVWVGLWMAVFWAVPAAIRAVRILLFSASETQPAASSPRTGGLMGAEEVAVCQARQRRGQHEY